MIQGQASQLLSVTWGNRVIMQQVYARLVIGNVTVILSNSKLATVAHPWHFEASHDQMVLQRFLFVINSIHFV
jgi:hypothetical protein